MTEQQLDKDGLEVDSTHERLVFDSIAALVLLFTALIGAYLPRYLSRNGALQAGPEGMTEARWVARAVEHLELDMPGRVGPAALAGAGGSGHNHAHFQEAAPPVLLS
eukprot:gene4834-5081_t